MPSLRISVAVDDQSTRGDQVKGAYVVEKAAVMTLFAMRNYSGGNGQAGCFYGSSTPLLNAVKKLYFICCWVSGDSANVMGDRVDKRTDKLQSQLLCPDRVL